MPKRATPLAARCYLLLLRISRAILWSTGGTSLQKEGGRALGRSIDLPHVALVHVARIAEAAQMDSERAESD